MKLKNNSKLGLIAIPALAALALTSCDSGGGSGTEEGGGEAAAPAEGQKEYTLEFPKALFVGTPVPVKLPNLEKTGDPKKTFNGPEGLTNLAAGKPTTTTSSDPIFGSIDFVTNGDKEGADGSFVELDPGPQSITIDLGQSSEIWAIAVWHYHMAAAAYFDVIVEISEDAEFTSPTVIYNNDDDNSSGKGVGTDPAYIETNHGRIIDAKGAKGQFVRLHSAGNTASAMNHYVEVEVWGE